MFNIFQIATGFIFLVFISSKIKQNHWKLVFSVIAAFSLTLEIVAVYLTGKLIDYRFYNHININAISVHGIQFVTQFILVTVLFILISFLLYFGSIKIQRMALNKNIFFVPVILISIGFLSLSDGIFNEGHIVYEIINAPEKDFDQALIDLGISPDKYVTPDKLTAKQGKNIVVLSIESVEQGFLGSHFGNITAYLNTLSKEWTFYNQMPPTPGGTWTAGSLYSHQAGMPAFFKGQGNDFFQGTSHVKLTGLGHILKEAGYNSAYLIGDAEFAGISDILSAYEIPVISQNNCIGKYPKTSFFNDYDLFREAKLQISKFKHDDKPFALFISTTNTHFPDGIYDKRMEEFIVKGQKNDLEFSISAVDYLIKDFITYLKKENLYENTAIFIFPDHVLMGTSGPTIDKLNQYERQLYLLTNIDDFKLPKKTSDTLYQIDLPRMIINGSQIKTNANFLTDLIETDNVIDYLKKNRINVTTLNNASVARNDYQDGINIRVIDNNLIIYSNEDTIKFALNEKENHETFDITFNPEMIAIKHVKINSNNFFSMKKYDMPFKRLHLLITVLDGKVDRTYFGNKQTVGIYKQGEIITYTKKDIHSVVESNSRIRSGLRYLKGIIAKFNFIYYSYINPLSQKKVGAHKKSEHTYTISANLYGKDTKRFIAHAGGEIDGKTYTNSLDAMNLNYRKGFRLFELDIVKTSDNFYVAAHDWKHWAGIAEYDGDLPPRLKTFMRHKIHGKYLPLDMNTINVWFAEHPDAILVTDKVNTPADFSNKFIDKNRLMMELFTWDAVYEGIKSGIKSAMPTGHILGQIHGDKIAYLKKLGITDVARTRRDSDSQNGLVKKMADSGINVFAFHINYDEGIDEVYVVCNERDYFYGMYADKWDFNADLDCSKYKDLPLPNQGTPLTH